MSRYENLRTYLEAMQRGGFGWVKSFEDALVRDGFSREAFLVGTYHGMLNDLVTIIGGPAVAISVVRAAEEIHHLQTNIHRVIESAERRETPQE